MTKPSKPVDLYLRVSRVGGREHLISPDEQERRARQLAHERGLKVGKVLTDLDESGGKWERPGLQEALTRVRDGKSGGLIVAWLDRLSRDSEHAHRLIRELHESGGVVYAPDAPSDWTSPEGELQAGIVFAFAQYVRSRARAGFERAKERAIMEGIPVATRPPVGYRKRSDRRLEPDPATAPVVRELFERRATGAGPTELAEFLEGRGVTTSQGSRGWSKPAVQSLVSNRVYLGELGYGKERDTDGKRRPRYVNPTAHEPIIDLATWEAAQHPNGRRLQRPRGEGHYMLTGLLRCAECGYVLQGTTTSRGKRIYRCVGRHSGGKCPGRVRASAELVERKAQDAFWALTDDLAATGTVTPSDESSQLESAFELADRRLAHAMTPEVQDAAGEGWGAMIRERRQDRDSAAEALGHARAAESAASVLPSTETLRGIWDSLTAADRREFIGTRFDAFALRRGESGLVLTAFPSGTAPDGLSRRGFRRSPGLHPIDTPASARVLTLQDAREGASEVAV
jgi:site-specific DNA recombinase